MVKNRGLTKTKQQIASLFWLGLLWLASFLVAGIIGFSYQDLSWQLADSAGKNIALSYRNDQTTLIAIAVSHLGFYGSLLVWLVVLGVLTVKREFKMLITSLLLSCGSVGAGYGLKLLTARLRPENVALVAETTHSFPSMHTMTAVVLYLTISYLVYYFSRRFLLSYLIFLIGLVLTVAIGLSRIYLGVHYVSDVVAGFILGGSWFLSVLFIEKCFCLLKKKR